MLLQEEVPASGTPPLPRKDNRQVLNEVAGAFFSSRALVWVAGLITAIIFGTAPHHSVALDPIAHYVRPFGIHFFNLLVSPGARYDSAWYLSIARLGYVHHVQAVFFPLYPLSVAVLGLTRLPDVIAGIVLSCAFAIGALYLLFRLVELDQGAEKARHTIWIVAWLPMALFLSAVYSESLFLLLTIGSMYAARRDQWWLAGVAGCLAAATRNSGFLLVVPLLLLYLYGPRPRPPDRQPAGRFAPRYAVRPDIAWIALVPVGMIGYLFYLHFAVGHPLAPFTAEHRWSRYFAPLGGIPLGIYAAVKSLVGIIPGVDPKLASHLSTLKIIRHEVELAFLALSGFLLWFGRRRLPVAYTAFAALSLAAAVSVPAHGEPLKSLPRFTLVIFPLWISLALWADSRRRLRALSAVLPVLLAAWTFLFVGWYWAA
jgi:hypothetical protein